MSEVVLGVQCRGEPVAEPSDHSGWAEDQAVQCNGCLGKGRPLTGHPPVAELCFRGREFDFQAFGPFGKCAEEGLEAAYVGTVRVRGVCEGEVVHVGDHDFSGDRRVEGGEVYEKK